MEPLYVTINQARARWGCGRSKLYKTLAARQIEAVKYGHRTLISVSSGDLFFRSLPALHTHGARDVE